VNDSAVEFAKLKMLHAGAVLHQEGGQPVVLLPKFSFLSGGKGHTMDLLLHPSQHSGYDTRLFFERQTASAKAGWTSCRVLERGWWAVSWKDVKPSMPWTSMLCEHLRAVE
jgi:hypothetical protein